MATVKSLVLLRNPETGFVEVLTPGVNAPGWATALLTNPEVIDQPDDIDAQGDPLDTTLVEDHDLKDPAEPPTEDA